MRVVSRLSLCAPQQVFLWLSYLDLNLHQPAVLLEEQILPSWGAPVLCAIVKQSTLRSYEEIAPLSL
jgi:hypothetical protein